MKLIVGGVRVVPDWSRAQPVGVVFAILGTALWVNFVPRRVSDFGGPDMVVGVMSFLIMSVPILVRIWAVFVRSPRGGV